MAPSTNTVLQSENFQGPAFPTPLGQWALSAFTTAISKMEANISPSDGERGAVLASPSRNNPNYYYHWVRDAARTMGEIAKLNTDDSVAVKDEYYQRMIDYVEFSKINQTTPTVSNSLGEPKFYVNGRGYNLPWGRPQNDGPAQRALTLTRWANFLLEHGESDYVRGVLYDGEEPSFSVIKADLDFVGHHWQDSCFDLWEEVDGTHFYTRLLQRTALQEGADLADTLNDSGAADFFRAQASAIEQSLSEFWDEEKGYLKATLNRVGGLDYKTSDLDVAVLLGAFQGYSQSHPFFAPTDDRILATAFALHNAFDPLYPINAQDRTAGGLPIYPGIGRYPEDRYTGTGQGDQGNPWFLCTLAQCGVLYKAAELFSQQKTISVTDNNVGLFNLAVSLIDSQLVLKSGAMLKSSTKAFKILVNGLFQMADAYLTRVRYHAGSDGSLSEQFSRYNGYMTSARDLTWSYVALAISLNWRKEAEPRMPDCGIS